MNGFIRNQMKKRPSKIFYNVLFVLVFIYVILCRTREFLYIE